MRFGWDISTAVIGFAAFDDGGKLLTVCHCDLTKVDDIYDKADRAAEFTRDLAYQRMGVRPYVHYVEDKLAGFSGGGSNAGTIMRLGAFNLLVSWLIRSSWAEAEEGASSLVHIHPSTVKAIMRKKGLVVPKGGDKKALTLEWVSKNVAGFPEVELTKKTKRGGGKPKAYYYDMSDACITCISGMARDR